MAMRRVRFVTALTALTTLVGPATAQDPPPLDPGADRLADLNRLIEVPSAVTDITEPLMNALSGMRPARASWGFFMSDESRGWASASSWASSEASRNAIDAAIEVTSEEGPKAIGLPYGTEGVEQTWIDAGIANETGEAGLIHGMQMGLLDGLENLMLAMSIEAWSAAEADDGDRVREVLVAWVRLARIVADREMADEKFFAYEMTRTGLQRFRDIVYTHGGLFDVRGFKEINEALSNDALELDAVRLPRGDRFEALQLIERTMEPEGGVDPTKFGLVMASGATGERPLELFARTAEMNAAGAVHAGWFDTYDELNKVLGDWRARWETPDFHDALLNRPTDYSTLSTTRFALIERTVGEIDDLFDERMNSLTELFGTRSAFGVTAFEDRSNRFPPALRAVSPQFVDELDVDPWSIMYRFRRGTEASITRDRYEKSDVFRYLVPIRDQRWGPREEKVPYEVEVVFESEPEAAAIPVVEQEEDDAADGGPARTISLDAWAAWERQQRVQAQMMERGPGGLKSALTGAIQQAEQMSQVSDAQLEEGRDNIMQMMEMFGGSNDGDFTDAYTEVQLTLLGVDRVTEDNLIEVARKEMALLVTEDGLKPAMDELLAMDDPSADDYIHVTRGRILEIVGDPPLPEEEMADAVGRSIQLDRFTVAFDDSVFLLYSVWENHEDDGARVVGPEGTDYLIWPPVPTLVREAQMP